MLASWFYQSLPLFSFVLHSFLPYHVGDDLWYVHYDFSVSETWVRANKRDFYDLDCYSKGF